MEEIAAETPAEFKHQPNGLPLTCVDREGHMWETEDADHPTYICPLLVIDPEFEEDFPESHGRQRHSLIYTDGHIAITVYETCYGIYTKMNGWKALNECFWKGTYLPEESIETVLKRAPEDNTLITRMLRRNKEA